MARRRANRRARLGNHMARHREMGNERRARLEGVFIDNACEMKSRDGDIVRENLGGGVFMKCCEEYEARNNAGEAAGGPWGTKDELLFAASHVLCREMARHRRAPSGRQNFIPAGK